MQAWHLSLLLTELRPRLSELVERATERFDRFIITRRGSAEAVLLAADEFEGLLETLEILADEKLAARLAEDELAGGGGHAFKEVRAALADSEETKLSSHVRRSYETLAHSDRRLFIRVDRALDRLAEEPRAGKPLVGPLRGRRSYRVGPVRIIYRFASAECLVLVLDIAPRGQAYGRRRDRDEQR